MAASIRRVCIASPLVIRGFLTNTVCCKPALQCVSHANSSLYFRSAAKPLSFVRLCSSQEEDPSVVKKKELTEADIAAGIAYLQSEDYIERYGKRPVFADYRRNHKGGVAPKKTRKRCVRGVKRIISGNPCPICRDENLVVHYKNVRLLEQFVCPHSYEVYSDERTGVCQAQCKILRKAVTEAQAYGLLPMSSPFVQYNYRDYYGKAAGMKAS
ncbi:28S ribosomal protein S18b, mitochondrial-like [Asterias rubens]|uniref:28S ribosomal protein S18b, mitochondrial-like n=1 Tax=Asterias rubens TaxID=7604 RepID=UPI00145530D8|nr:28S ribosomal protein S18b, mitochondrial-like [Asterias rubens]